MKRFPDSVDRLSVKDLTLDSRHGSVKLFISRDGKITFKPINNSQTGSFSIDLNNPIYICEEFQYEGKTYRRAFVGCTYHCG